MLEKALLGLKGCYPSKENEVNELAIVVFDFLQANEMKDPLISEEKGNRQDVYDLRLTTFNIDDTITYNTWGEFKRKNDGVIKEGKLTVTENRLFFALVQNPDATATHGDICRQVWGDDREENEALIKKYVQKLRGKLDPKGTKPENSIIQSIRGVGYKLRSPVSKIKDTHLNQ